MLVKVSELKSEQIKVILRQRELPATGNKSELILRLTQAIGSEEVEMDTPEPNVQNQIDELRNMMQQLMTSVMQNTNRECNLPNALSREVGNESLGENRSHYSVKEIAETIPEFNPTDDGSLGAEQFVNRVNTALAAYRFEEKALILAVYSKLKGSAKLWLDASEEMYSSWRVLAGKLVEEFGVHLDEAEIHKKLANTQRESNEGIIDYCFRTASLGRKYKLSDQAIIKYTRDGLRNRDLQSATAAMRFSSLREMRETFSEFLRNTPSSSYAAPLYATKSESENVKIKIEKLDSPKKKDVKCFNCLEEGHFSYNCPKPQNRPRCTDCQKVHRQGEPQNCGGHTPVVRRVGSCNQLFTRKIVLNGMELSAFIDTGSQCNMVRRTVVGNLSCNLEPCSMSIKGICGGVQTLKSCFKAKIKADDVKFDAVFYVADDDLLDEDVLIGQNIFEEENIRALVENGQFKFERVDTENPVRRGLNIQCGDVVDSAKSVLFTLITDFNDVFADNSIPMSGTNMNDLKVELDTEEERRLEQQMTHVGALIRIPREESCDIETADLRIDKADIVIGDWIFSTQLQEMPGTSSKSVLNVLEITSFCGTVERKVTDGGRPLTSGNKLMLQDDNSNSDPNGKAKFRFDKVHSKQDDVGDLVPVGNETPETGSSRKLEHRFKGPFQVAKILESDRNVVEDLPCSSRKQRHYCSDDLKLYCSIPPYDEEDCLSYSEDAG